MNYFVISFTLFAQIFSKNLDVFVASSEDSVVNVETQLNPRITLSYVVKESQKEVIQLKRHLEAVGFKQIFLDIDYIELGEDWTEVLNKAVLNCDVFIPLITSRYGLTKWTKREFKLADLKSKHIIPINFLDDWPPDCLAIQLSSIEYIKWESNPQKIARNIKFDLQKNFIESKGQLFLRLLSVDSLNSNLSKHRYERSGSYKPRPKIMINFHSKQKNFTEFLRKELWPEFDIWPIECGDDWKDSHKNHSNEYLMKQFKSEADSASLVITVLSESYSLSKACKQQAFYCDFCKRVIPIKYGQFETPEYLTDLFIDDEWGTPSTDLEWLSFSHSDTDSFTEKLNHRIAKLMSQ